jgi:hypothetical protein
MSLEDFDFDIESYSILELLNFFNVPKTATKDQLLKTYKTKKEKINKIEEEISKNNLLEFIDNAYNLVKKYFNFPEPVVEKQVYRDLETPNFIPNEQQVFYTKQNDRINPIQREEIKQVVSIDSTFRENYSSTTSGDFIINLPVELDHVSKMKLISVEIPYTFYFFSEKKKNNKFTITVTDTTVVPQTESYDIIIPDGIWYSADFEDQINEYFDRNSDGLHDLIHYLKLNGSGDQYNNGKTIFRFKTSEEIDALIVKYPSYAGVVIPARPASGDLSYSISVTDVTNNLIIFEQSALFIMGFVESDMNISITNTDTYNTFYNTYIGSLISTYIYGRDINAYLFISVDDFVGNSKDQIVSCLSDGYLGKNILGRIQITNPEFTTIINNSSDYIFKERDYFGNVKIRKLHIQVLNKYGEVVELNGSELSLALEYTQNYNSKNQLKFDTILNNDRQQVLF